MARAAKKVRLEKEIVLIDRVSEEFGPQIENDTLAVEEPLEIRIGYFPDGKFTHKPISITMRTPGSDFELAAGFLFTEGIIQSADQITDINYCGKLNQPKNTVRVDLSVETKVDLKKLERHFYTSSSCGVCGKSSLDALSTGAQPIANTALPQMIASEIQSIPGKLRAAQSIFEETGGLHAAGLFSTGGELIEIKEDVGRHNAVDKLIGSSMIKNDIAMDKSILFLSGRASFELVQKAVMARIPIVAAVSAPSSLAVAAAKEFNITLLGFVRDGNFNIYSGKERIIL